MRSIVCLAIGFAVVRSVAFEIQFSIRIVSVDDDARHTQSQHDEPLRPAGVVVGVRHHVIVGLGLRERENGKVGVD